MTEIFDDNVEKCTTNKDSFASITPKKFEGEISLSDIISDTIRVNNGESYIKNNPNRIYKPIKMIQKVLWEIHHKNQRDNLGYDIKGLDDICVTREGVKINASESKLRYGKLQDFTGTMGIVLYTLLTGKKANRDPESPIIKISNEDIELMGKNTAEVILQASNGGFKNNKEMEEALNYAEINLKYNQHEFVDKTKLYNQTFNFLKDVKQISIQNLLINIARAKSGKKYMTINTQSVNPKKIIKATLERLHYDKAYKIKHNNINLSDIYITPTGIEINTEIKTTEIKPRNLLIKLSRGFYSMILGKEALCKLDIEGKEMAELMLELKPTNICKELGMALYSMITGKDTSYYPEYGMLDISHQDINIMEEKTAEIILKATIQKGVGYESHLEMLEDLRESDEEFKPELPLLYKRKEILEIFPNGRSDITKKIREDKRLGKSDFLNNILQKAMKYTSIEYMINSMSQN